MPEHPKHRSWLGPLSRRRAPTLGKRELAVLDLLWREEPLTTQEIHDRLPDRTFGLTTTQSTLERLHRKQLLARSRQARAYLYRPLLSREGLISALLNDISEDIAGGDMTAMISGFNTYLGATPPSQTLGQTPADPNRPEAKDKDDN